MNWLFRRNDPFVHLRKQIQPDSAWLSRTRRHLVTRAGRGVGQHPAFLSSRSRLKEALLILFPASALEAVSGPVMAVVSVLGLLLGGSMASVSASERAIPGDLLYPVKLASEQAQILLQKEKTEKIKLKTEFVGRRAEEIRTTATSEMAGKPALLKEAAGILKQDLDTLKTQLSEVKTVETKNVEEAKKVVETARLVDQKTVEVANVVKDVKTVIDEQVTSPLAEVEAAATTAGIKAVEVLIDTHETPQGKQVISTEEIKQSVAVRVEGLEKGITTAAEKVKELASATTGTAMLAALPVTTSTKLTLLPSTSSSTATALKEPISQLNSAKTSLNETKQLLEENKLGELKEKLSEAAKAMTVIEKTIQKSVESINENKVDTLPTGSTSTTTSSVMTTPTETVTGTKPMTQVMSTSTVTTSSTNVQDKAGV